MIKPIKIMETSNDKPRTKLYKILRKRGISQMGLHNLIKDRCKTHLGNDVISRIVNGKKTNYELHTLLKLSCLYTLHTTLQYILLYLGLAGCQGWEGDSLGKSI